MEKLEPILRYRFWILFGVAILAPSIGWMISSKAMTEEVDKTWKNVEGKFGEVTGFKTQASTFANATYTDGLTEITKQRRDAFGKAHVKLREIQKSRMVWPAPIADDMSKVGYLKSPPDEKVMKRVLFIYNDTYLPELQRVRNIVSPYDQDSETGLVEIPLEVLPRANMDDWIGTGPSVPVLWDSQEDIWLLTAIMEAIARVNKDATTVVDAPIKAIFEVSLRGGSLVKAQAGVKMKKKAAVDNVSQADNKGEKKGPAAREVDFDPRDEFGEEKIPNPNAKAAVVDDDDGGKRRAKRAKDDDVSRSKEPLEIAKRYIEGDNSPNSQHKVRGFYLKLAIKNTFVPELLAELSNMPYPTEIVRAQLSDEVDRSFVKGRINRGNSPAQSEFEDADPLAAIGAAAPRQGGGLFAGGGFSKGAREKADNAKRDAGPRASEKKSTISKKGRAANLELGSDKDLLQASLDDPYLATVAISGTMTIYRQAFDDNDKNMKPNPSTKPDVVAPAGNEEQAPEKAPDTTPAKQDAAINDKKASEQSEPKKTTNGK